MTLKINNVLEVVEIHVRTKFHKAKWIWCCHWCDFLKV